MSLRAQFFLSVVLSLLLGLLGLGSTAVWHAHRSVETEMSRALDAADHVVDNALLSLPQAGIEAYLTRLVRSFDGNRHVRVTLVEAGVERASSQIVPPEPVPAWFMALLNIPRERRVDASARLAHGELVVSSDPRNEISEVWDDFRDGALILSLFSLLVLALLHLAMTRIQAPLTRLTAGFAALGGGDYGARVFPAGPRETIQLADSFNRMAARLEQMESANARMGTQILDIQEEERTELARELHDEMGPFLFAMRVDAEIIEKAAKERGESAIAARARAVGEAVTHIQRHVRLILRQLRPAEFVDLGLQTAIENLAAFWRRHLDLAITVDIDGGQDGFGAAIDTAIYRLVQEGLTNAARHGKAAHVRIHVTADARTIGVSVEDDGLGLAGSGAAGGLGLKGMHERLAGLGGILSLKPRPDGGAVLSARIPCQPAEVPA